LSKTFFGGVHPPTYKPVTVSKAIKPATVPKKVIFPLSQHIGKPSQPIVKPGDHVDIGTKIAQAAGFISTNMHSPVSGTVKAIEQAAHPISGKCLSIIIETDNSRGEQCSPPTLSNIDKLSPEAIIQAISEAGIVGMGGAAFPTHVKLSPPKDKKIDTLIINGSECEPYLSCDQRLMVERPQDVVRGALIISKAIGAANCIIAIEDNKPDAIKAMKQADVRVVVLPTKYPQGAEKQLIKTVLNRDVPSGGLPFDVGVLVQNVATAVAVYEAVIFGKPLYERVVTIAGDCVKEPGNLLVKIGTPVSDLVNDCGGFINDPAKVIFGGPMMGIAQGNLDVPVLKGTSGILFLSKKAAVLEKEGTCIRCGGCVRVCPMGLSPTNIYYATVKDKIDLANEYNVSDCIECGACSFECPAKLDLTGMIKYAKWQINL